MCGSPGESFGHQSGPFELPSAGVFDDDLTSFSARVVSKARYPCPLDYRATRSSNLYEVSNLFLLGLKGFDKRLNRLFEGEDARNPS